MARAEIDTDLVRPQRLGLARLLRTSIPFLRTYKEGNVEKKIKKLVFNKEVIKRLNKGELEQVAGASYKTITVSCVSLCVCTGDPTCASVLDTETTCG